MLGLQWSQVDLATRTARSPTPKPASRCARCLTPLAMSFAHCRASATLYFRRLAIPSKPMAGFHKVWLRIAERAALPTM